MILAVKPRDSEPVDGLKDHSRYARSSVTVHAEAWPVRTKRCRRTSDEGMKMIPATYDDLTRLTWLERISMLPGYGVAAVFIEAVLFSILFVFVLTPVFIVTFLFQQGGNDGNPPGPDACAKPTPPAPSPLLSLSREEPLPEQE